VGFDDIHLAEFTIPPLTTVQMSQHQLAKIAFQALLNEVDETRPHEHRKHELVTSLILRKSTSLAAAAKSSSPKTGRTPTARKSSP